MSLGIYSDTARSGKLSKELPVPGKQWRDKLLLKRKRRRVHVQMCPLVNISVFGNSVILLTFLLTHAPVRFPLTHTLSTFIFFFHLYLFLFPTLHVYVHIFAELVHLVATMVLYNDRSQEVISAFHLWPIGRRWARQLGSCIIKLWRGRQRLFSTMS